LIANKHYLAYSLMSIEQNGTVKKMIPAERKEEGTAGQLDAARLFFEGGT
jgi:hypothetical protein